MKKIVFLFVTFFFLFLIYHCFNNSKINYVSIGDNVMNNSLNTYNYNNYLKEYLLEKNKLGSYNNYFYNKSILSLYRDIQNNRTIKDRDNEYYFKKVLRESDVLIISVGMEELSNNFSKYNMNNNYEYFSKMYNSIEKLIFEIKKYAKGKIFFLGYYNPTNYFDAKVDEFFYDMDVKLNRLMMDNNISYIDLYEIIKEKPYKSSLNSCYLNSQGYQKIANIIMFYIA